MCVRVCLSSIGGQTAGPIMTKFGTHMRIDLGMVPTKYWPHEWPGSVGSLGPISESGQLPASSASRCVANDVTMNPSTHECPENQ